MLKLNKKLYELARSGAEKIDAALAETDPVAQLNSLTKVSGELTGKASDIDFKAALSIIGYCFATTAIPLIVGLAIPAAAPAALVAFPIFLFTSVVRAVMRTASYIRVNRESLDPVLQKCRVEISKRFNTDRVSFMKSEEGVKATAAFEKELVERFNVAAEKPEIVDAAYLLAKHTASSKLKVQA